MAKVIIGIHGLGNKPPKKQLEEWWLTAINEGIRLSGNKIKLPHFELVYWADILYEKPQTLAIDNKESPYFLDEVYTKAPKKFKVEEHKIRHKLVDWLRRLLNIIFLKSDFELRYSFLAEKFLHKFFRELEVYYTEDCEKAESIDCVSKMQISQRLIDVLKKYQNDDVFLIAHSMGTIIAFDVLSFVANQTNIKTFVTIGSPLGLPLVISKIAEESKKNNRGHIKLQTPNSVTHHWYNFSDIKDEIALDYKLSDDFSENTHGVHVEDYLVVNNYVMNGVANPHKSYGYLRTHEFSSVLIKFIQEKEPAIHKLVLRKIRKVFVRLKISVLETA